MDSDSYGHEQRTPLHLRDLLTRSANFSPEALALLAPERLPLSYERLLNVVDDAGSALRASGMLPQHRVAVVLPNGPEFAACLLGVASHAVCVPLNPAYRADEFDFYFSELRVDGLIVELGSSSPAVAIANACGIPIIELVPQVNLEAGVFFLKAVAPKNAVPRRPLECAEPPPADVALLLHTSGTSAKPKVVPFTHANLAHSAENIKLSLNLTAGDRCLNVMPLFHSHGIMTGTLASIAAGGSVICPPGFYAPRFFSWVESFRPTWYTAVPTMHLSVLMRAPQNRGLIKRSALRFIRSGSSPLAPQVMQELEDTFSAPVIEAYATTETSQICSNPLPPKQQKPGSVGIATGTRVGIMGDDGNPLPQGEEGEIVVQGPNVMNGYDGDPAANEGAFRNGWFRTGDRGRLDEDGYLFVTGTAKEMINRGGEKIAPREIDEILLRHPAVAEAVTFALPDSSLGEDVAAAVVVANAAQVTESELCDFVSRKLADFKVPSHIIFVQEIPKTPTGKPQRVGMASRLGMIERTRSGELKAAAGTPPRNPMEVQLCAIWTEVLGVEAVGIHDNFFNLGGDSLIATSLLSRVTKVFGEELTLRSLFAAPTVAQLAVLISKSQGAEPDLQLAHPFVGEA
jgi:acyl-CoA synthetase (AMP-forming)/AMP-acid ligase II/acyl carrier protein